MCERSFHDGFVKSHVIFYRAVHIPKISNYEHATGGYSGDQPVTEPL